MSQTCIGADVEINGTLSEFGETILEYEPESPQSTPLITDTPESTPHDSAELIERARGALKNLDIPVTGCPREPYEDSKKCIFHLSKKEKEEYDVTEQEIREAFINLIKNEPTQQPDPKTLVNVTLPELQLHYLDLDANNNQPIDLRFSTIGNLDIKHTTIGEILRLDYSTIHQFDYQKSEFLSGFTARGARIQTDTITCTENKFEGPVNFSEATVQAEQINFQDNVFTGELIFSDCEFILTYAPSTRPGGVSNITFNDNKFQQNVEFDDIRIIANELKTQDDSTGLSVSNIKVTFRRCDYEGNQTTFKNAQFGHWSQQGSRINIEYEPQSEAEFSDLSFTDSEFTGAHVEMSAIKVAGELNMEGTDFRQTDLDLTDARISQDFKLGGAKFSENQVDFNGLITEDSIQLDGTIFERNNLISFEDCTIGSGATFENTVQNSTQINYHGATIENDCIFSDATLSGKEINFSDFQVSSDLDFTNTTIDAQTVNFDELKVPDGRLSFNRSNITAERVNFTHAQLDVAEFTNSMLDTDVTSFDDTKCTSTVTFQQAELTGQISFNQVTFRNGPVSFRGIDATHADLRFVGTGTGNNKSSESRTIPVDFSEGTVLSGQFQQPKSPGTYYDFTEATVGNLELEYHEDSDSAEPLFSYFRFFETSFEGFDFSKSVYRKQLKENNWRLDTVPTDSQTNQSSPSGLTFDLTPFSASPITLLMTQINKTVRLLRHGSDPDNPFDGLESTYRKAKIGADEQGDSDASSKFFQKELLFRRRTHGQRVWLRNVGSSEDLPTTWERLHRAWLWITNWMLWITSGYGERPWRVVLSSLGVIVMFTFVYATVWNITSASRPPELEGFSGVFTLSAEMFTAIILGGSEVDALPIRVISYFEGFIGSFFIALFVLTITRSVRR